MSQQGPTAFIAAGRGLSLVRPEYWEPEPNTSISAGYRFAPRLLLTACLDFNKVTFKGDENPKSTGSYSLNSFLLGVKVSDSIPGSILSPYFIGAFGPSKVTSDQDTVFTHHHGSLQVYGLNRGTTITILGAVGSDIRIYKGLFCFCELRVNAGLDSKVYEFDILWRAGIGFNFY